MSNEPDVVVTHVLIDVYEDQDAREEKSKEYIRPIRDRIGRIKTRVKKEENDENDSREKEREKQKIKVGLHITITVTETNASESIYYARTGNFAGSAFAKF